MGTSPLPTEMLRTPPLGGRMCPDPRWNGGRALVLQGPNAFLGARWVLTASLQGQPASSIGEPPPPPPSVAEGAIPFIEVGGVVQALEPPAAAAEGSTAYVEDTAT